MMGNDLQEKETTAYDRDGSENIGQREEPLFHAAGNTAGSRSTAALSRHNIEVVIFFLLPLLSVGLPLF
jgi:hypothetical protein